jgi:6-phosphogluconolactonase
LIPRRDFIAGAGGFAGVLATRSLAGAFQIAKPSAATTQFMYVGSFTTPERGHGEGIAVFRRGPSGSWSQVQLLKDLENPSFLVIDKGDQRGQRDRQGHFLYAVHSDGDKATAYRIDPASGRLTLVNHQPTGGQNGVHLVIDATGRFLVVANYASGTLALLPINQDGSLAALADLATLTGTPGPHKTEQLSSHPHHCPFDPTRKFIVVPDKGLDKVFVFRIDAAAGKLVPNNSASVVARAGAGPRHVVFHPTGPYAYVVNELGSSLTTYHFDSNTGELKPLQIVPTIPSTFTGNNTAAEIAVAPSGRFVYGSNRGHDSIAIFAIDSATGMLTSVAWESTQGTTPRYFGLHPSGRELYAANQTSDTVVVFRVNESTGKLAATGEILKAGAPCTIAFL